MLNGVINTYSSLMKVDGQVDLTGSGFLAAHLHNKYNKLKITPPFF